MNDLAQLREQARAEMDNMTGRDKVVVITSADKGYVRQAKVAGQIYYSIVDVIALLGESGNDPRKYWGDHKKRILKLDPQLSDSIRRLKLVAGDGKLRETDVAPLTDCLVIASFMQTPLAIALMRVIFEDWGNYRRMSSETRYRLSNMEKGLEWAADTIHQRMEDENLLGDES